MQKLRDSLLENISKSQRIALGGLGVVAGLALLLNYNQERFIYHPVMDNDQYSKNNSLMFRNPSCRDLPYEDIVIAHEGVELKGWFIKQDVPANYPTVIFFHENAGNLGYRLTYLEAYYRMAKCNIVIVGYRGFDESTGSPNQIGIEKDSLAIVKYTLNKLNIDKKRLYAHGRSLGGAVTVYACSKLNYFRGIILENTFTSIQDVVVSLVPAIRIAKYLFTRNKWNTSQTIQQITTPILFISSGKDELVPYGQMEQLKQLAVKSQSVEEYHIPNGDHNSNWQDNQLEYFDRIQQFINK